MIRTPDPLLRRQVLYPAELRARQRFSVEGRSPSLQLREASEPFPFSPGASPMSTIAGDDLHLAVKMAKAGGVRNGCLFLEGLVGTRQFVTRASKPDVERGKKHQADGEIHDEATDNHNRKRPLRV